MFIGRGKLYAILLIACFAGYVWLFYAVKAEPLKSNGVELCLIKHTTNIPCPSCGSTRSVVSLIHGDFLQSLYINPLGIIIVAIMFVTPIWILVDFVRRKETLFNFYKRTEVFLRKPKIAMPLILLVLINWIWNITKGL